MHLGCPDGCALALGGNPQDLLRQRPVQEVLAGPHLHTGPVDIRVVRLEVDAVALRRAVGVDERIARAEIVPRDERRRAPFRDIEELSAAIFVEVEANLRRIRHRMPFRAVPVERIDREEPRVLGGEDLLRDHTESFGAGKHRRAPADSEVGREACAAYRWITEGIVAAEEVPAIGCHGLYAIVTLPARIGVDHAKILEGEGHPTDLATTMGRLAVGVESIVDRVPDHGAAIHVLGEQLLVDDSEVLVPDPDHALLPVNRLAQRERAVDASVGVADVPQVNGCRAFPNQAAIPADLEDTARMGEIDALGGAGRPLDVPNDVVELAWDRVDGTDSAVRGLQRHRVQHRREDECVLHGDSIPQRHESDWALLFGGLADLVRDLEKRLGVVGREVVEADLPDPVVDTLVLAFGPGDAVGRDAILVHQLDRTLDERRGRAERIRLREIGA